MITKNVNSNFSSIERARASNSSTLPTWIMNWYISPFVIERLRNQAYWSATVWLRSSLDLVELDEQCNNC